MKRKVAIFTGNRAEYGLQVPILKEIIKNKNLEYFLIVLSTSYFNLEESGSYIDEYSFIVFSTSYFNLES